MKLLAILSFASLAAVAAQAPCADPPPAGFRTVDEIAWEGPWAVDARTSTPFPSVSAMNGPLPIRFDDGTRGTVRVIEVQQDRSRVDVVDDGGRAVSTGEVWLAYGRVTVIAVDLVGGPGDELMIVRIPGRSAPPAGHDLKIWRLDRPAPVDLTSTDIVLAKIFGTMPIACARWQARMSIDASAPKPRPIVIRHELGSRGCCRIFADDDSRPSVDALRRPRRLDFDSAVGRYADSLAGR